MTYRDPNEPAGAESPTEAYRVPPAAPAAPPATASPTVAATPSRRSGRIRWAAAIAVVALVVVVSGVAAALLTGRAPNAKVLGWVPADTIAYGEVRLDLPGDQRQNVAEFLSHFPGFDDQAAIDTKLDEAFDQFVSSVSEGDQTYTRDIEPWFGGEIAFAISDLPDPAAMNNPESMESGMGAVLLSIKDQALAQAWLDGVTSDAQTTTQDYEGVTITTVPGSKAMRDGPVGYAVTDEVAVLGSISGIQDVLDTKGASTVAQDPEFAAALNSGNGDHVGFFYYDMAAYWDWAMGLAEESEMSQMGITDAMRNSLPAWVAGWMRVEGDALSFQAVSAAPSQRLGPTENRASTLAAHAPATSLVYAETHDYGKALTDMLGLYQNVDIPEEATQQLEQAVGMFGGTEGLIGWIGDVAFVVNDPGDGFEGGVLIQPTDATKAENLFLTLRGMIQLGGASLGVSVADEQHGDATITTVDFGELRQLMAQTGETADPEVLGFFGGSDAHVRLSWAVTDDLVVIGVGPDFVKHVLDTDAASSLAEHDRFTSQIERTGRENAGMWFADITAIRAAIEGAPYRDIKSLEHYEREIKPFLEPFDVLAGSTVIGGSNPDKTTFLMTVK